MKLSRIHLAEWALFSLGALLIGKCVIDLSAGHQFQQRALTSAVEHGVIRTAAITPTGYEKTKIVGRLMVPRLGLSVPVVEGDGTEQLRLAAGHVSNTPLPGEPGNSVIAGHRDTVFYDLRKIEAGDKMEFADADNVHKYRVSSTRIVAPEDVSVMNKADGRRLTLVTCYPFSFVGPAPQRFVVVAEAEGSE